MPDLTHPIRFSSPAYLRNRTEEPLTQDQSPKREQDQIIYSKVILPWLKSRPEKTLDVLSLPGEGAVWEHNLIEAMNREGVHKTLRVYGVERSPEFWRKLVNATSHLSPSKALQFQNRANLLIDSGITTEQFTEVTLGQKLRNAGFDIIYYDGTFKYKPSEFDSWLGAAWDNNLFGRDCLFGVTYCFHRTLERETAHLDAPGRGEMDSMFTNGYHLHHSWEQMDSDKGGFRRKTAGLARRIVEILENRGRALGCEVEPSYLTTYKNRSASNKGLIMCSMWFRITSKTWGFERVSPFSFKHPEEVLSSLEKGLTMDG